MIFSENRLPPRIASGAGSFGIMLYMLYGPRGLPSWRAVAMIQSR
jgi:hypothetical protein